MYTRRKLLQSMGCVAAIAPFRPLAAAANPPKSFAIHNAQWFDGTTFLSRQGWCVDGRFTFREPDRIDQVIDLADKFLVPPFADAHNHGIGTGVDSRDRAMIDRYLRDGVFYAQIMGNGPLSRSDRDALGLDRPTGLDATFAQGTITGAGGHPMGLLRNVLLPQGYFPGRSLETLADWRFHEISTEEELRAKWPTIRSSRGDFIKFFLFCSDEFAARAKDSSFFGKRGINPALAAPIVAMAHRDGLRAAAHVVNAADFRVALDARADVIAHLPTDDLLTESDARRAATQRVAVITTCGFLTRLARNSPQQSAQIALRQAPNLKVLKDAGVDIVIGSDDPGDTTHGELEHLRTTRVFGDGELLKIWTGNTARSIYPGRQIGSLDEGQEASFLALEGNPLSDWSATRRIALRMKQGSLMQTATSSAPR